MAVRAQESGSHKKTSDDHLDSWRRSESELRRLARAAELRGVLQLSPVFIAAGLCGFCAGLSREHRIRARLAQWCFYGCRRQRCQRCLDVGELSEDAAVRR